MYLARRLILATELETYHTAESLGQRITDNRDNSGSTTCHHREGKCIITTDDIKVIWLVLDNLIHLLQTSTCLLDGYYVGEVTGDATGCLRLHIDARATRHIIKNDRQWTNLRNSLEVLIESFLRRLVVIRTNAQDTINTTPVSRLDFFHHGCSIVATAIFQYLNSSMVHLFHQLGNLIFLILGETRSLTCSCKDTEEVCTIVYLKLNQFLQRLIVNCSVGLEWGNQGYT